MKRNLESNEVAEVPGLESVPANKKSKSSLCRFNCGRMSILENVCCSGCCESADNVACDTIHQWHCDMNIICNITKPKPNNNEHPFWTLFSDRKYRTIYQQEVSSFTIEISNIEKIIPAQSYETGNDELDGLLITEFQKQYELKRSELLMDKTNVDLIGQMDTFFKHYQYGDGLDIHGYRGTGLYLIGYTYKNMHLNNNDNNIYELLGNKSELRFIKTWSEYGYGRPLEFMDAPTNYFGDCENEYRLFDPIRMKGLEMNVNTESKEEVNGNDECSPYETFYTELMEDIRLRKLNPMKEEYVWGEKEIDLNQFPDGYIVIYTGWEGSFDYILRSKLKIDFVQDDENVLVDEWVYLYDKAMQHTKKRIETLVTDCLKGQIGDDIINMFLPFLI